MGSAPARRQSAYATLLGSGACTLVAAAQTLVLLPVYLSQIGPSLYGAWMATGEVFVWLLAFDFGVPNLLIQRTGAFLAQRDARGIGTHFATSLLVLFCIAVLLFFVVFSLAPFVPGAFGVSSAEGIELVGALRLGAGAMCVMLVAYGFVGLARGLQDTPLVQGAALLGTVASFAVAALLLFAGFGLASIAYGLIVRASFTLIGGVLFLFARVERPVRSQMRIAREPLRDILKNCPPMFAAGLSYALMNNSMITIAAVMFRPEAAVVLGVTRKVADFARSVLDMVGHASYGGFANLFAEGRLERVRSVYRELEATFFVVAVGLLAAYVASNPAVIANWVGPEMYGGFGLTLALAGAVGAGAWSYFQIGLYRSMGRHAAASSALLVECVARLGAMVSLALWLGPIGLALGALLTAVISGTWASRRIALEMCASRDRSALAVWIVRALPFVVAGTIAFWGTQGGWSYAIGTALLVGVASVVALLIVDPALAHLRTSVARRLLGGEA